MQRFLKFPLDFSCPYRYNNCTDNNGGEEMSPRPKSDKSKKLRFEIRMNQETAEKLECCAQMLQTSKTEVIQKGIDMVLTDLKKQ